MKNLRIRRDIRRTVQLYILATDETLHRQNELTSFIALLSPSLKRSVYCGLYVRMLLSNVLFRSLLDLLAAPEFNTVGRSHSRPLPLRSAASGFLARHDSHRASAQSALSPLERLLDFLLAFMQPALTLPEQSII